MNKYKHHLFIEHVCFVAGVKSFVDYIVTYLYMSILYFDNIHNSVSCPSFPQYLVPFIFLIVTLISVKHLFVVSLDIRTYMMCHLSVYSLLCLP